MIKHLKDFIKAFLIAISFVIAVYVIHEVLLSISKETGVNVVKHTHMLNGEEGEGLLLNHSPEFLDFHITRISKMKIGSEEFKEFMSLRDNLLMDVAKLELREENIEVEKSRIETEKNLRLKELEVLGKTLDLVFIEQKELSELDKDDNDYNPEVSAVVNTSK